MKKKKPVVVAVSGGFDPIHIGHTNMLKKARELGTVLVVILNNDNWLLDKKGFVFASQTERARIISAIKHVDRVYITKHKKGDKDRSVCNALKAIRPDIFANGGDRMNAGDIPEAELCKRLGIKMHFGIGGGKIQSSSWLTGRLSAPVVKKPWGHMQTFCTRKNWWLKTLTVLPGKRLSLQSHKKRAEIWVVVEGKARVTVGKKTRLAAPFDVLIIKKGQIHRVANSGKKTLTLVEVACGPAFENDIVRYEDDYGRV